jgi:hypothetical protein
MKKVFLLLFCFGTFFASQRIDKALEPYSTAQEFLISQNYQHKPDNSKHSKLTRELFNKYFQEKEPIIPLNEFLSALYKARELTGKLLALAHWVDGDSPISADYFLKPFPGEKFSYETNPNYYVPFEKGIILNENEQYTIIPNLHGGVHTLVKVLADHISFDTYHLNNENMHLIFVGNYVNEGIFSVEVLYIIARIFTENPSHVHLLRGRNEVPDKELTGGFRYELETKYPDISSNDIDQIFSFFDCLIEALWIRSEKNLNEVTLVTHAGIELGDTNIAQLFDNNHLACFKQVGVRHKGEVNIKTQICRRKMLNLMPKKLQKLLKKIEETSNVHTFCNFYPYAPDNGICSCKSTGKNHHFRIQYHTGELTIDKSGNKSTQSPLQIPSNSTKEWVYRQPIFDYFASYLLTHNFVLKQIFRGNDHKCGIQPYNIYPIMEKILSGNNIFRIICTYSPQERNDNDKKNEYCITTVGVAPDTVYGVPQKGNKEFPKDFPGVLTFTTITINGQETTKTYDSTSAK